MVKRIRRRFVIVAFIAVSIVLAFLMTAINITNYRRVTESADEILDILAANDGKFIDKPQQFPEMSPETPFDTRFFTVEYLENGDYIVNVKNIASVDENEAKVLSDSVIDEDDEYGYYRMYRYKKVINSDSTMIIFINWERHLTNANIFMIVSLSFSILALVIISIVVFFLSKKILAPILNGYERQNRFITNASHELKTPLTIISVNNDLIELENGESESTVAISKQINRLTQMVNTLTTLAKIDGINEIKKLQTFNISEVIYDMVDSLDESKKEKISLEVEENIEYIGDEGLIRQLLSVILDNAIKYSISYIIISCKKVSGKNKFELSVTNDSFQEEIESGKYFERFFRSDLARASGIEGSGIGLSIAKDIVYLHKGNIKIVNENKIFTIKVTL